MDSTKVVVTFQTTTEAMAWERACRAEGLPGRLIPMPVQISAQCGLAWLVPSGEKGRLVERAMQLRLNYAEVVELK